MNSDSGTPSPERDLLAGYREDLQRLGVDCEKLQEHVHRNMHSGSLFFVYKPSFSASSKLPSDHSVPERVRKRMEKTGSAATLVEIILAHDAASQDSALAGTGICLDELARRALIAKEALRALIEREEHLRTARSKGGKAAHQRDNSARQELIRLLHAKKPADGWPDIHTAVAEVLPGIHGFLAHNPSLQPGMNLPVTLKRWIKTHPDVAL